MTDSCQISFISRLLA